MSQVKISPRAHVITEEHIGEDAYFKITQGSTSKGIAPCYADKYRRVGIQAKDIEELREFMWDENCMEMFYAKVLKVFG